MNKNDILNASRNDHQNKDLAEIEVVYQAGSHASRVGALVCYMLVPVIFHACPYDDLQPMGHILQHTHNAMVRSFYPNETEE